MNLVVGATGLLGSEICRELASRGKRVRGLIRTSSDPAKIDALRKAGVETVNGDLQDRPSLERACAGVENVISTASTTFSRQAHDSLLATDRDGQLNLIEAAKKAGVRRFVFISVSGNLEGDSDLHVAKRAVEEKLRRSGLNYTILRPSCFMEIWLSPALGFDAANRKAQVFGSGQNPVSYVSLFDVVSFAVEVIGNPKAFNQTIELGGPEALTPDQVVKIFEDRSGGKFEITHVPEEALRQQRDQASESYQKTFATLSLGVAGGDPIPMDDTLRKFPAKLKSVRDFARETLGR